MAQDRIRYLLRIPVVLTALLALLMAGGCGDDDSSPPAISTAVVLPLVNCWYNGQPAYYIQTEASDPDVARAQNVHYVARLADTITAGAVDDIYAVTNFTQGNVIPSAPIPAGPDNADPEYTPLWRVSTVTWVNGTTPHTLTSEEEVLAAETAGMVTIAQTDIVVNCPVIFTSDGGLLPTATITIGGAEPTVELPLVKCWYNGRVAYYIQTEASDPDVARAQNVHYVARLADTITADAVDDIYVVTNFTQGNVIPSAPIPAGPDNADPEYTPLWRVSTVTWATGTTPHTLTSEEEVLAAEAAGQVTITQTDIVVNCPVISTPDGGKLPTATLL